MNNKQKGQLTRLLRLLDKGNLKHAVFGEEAKGRNKNKTIHIVTFIVEVDENLTENI